MRKTKHLGILVEDELHAKLKYISSYEGRSMNGKVVHLIQKCIRDFEKENGKIDIKDIKQ